MFKNILGATLLLGLVFILIFNIFGQNDSSTSSYEQIESEQPDNSPASPATIGIGAGEKAPDFQLETMEGELLSLSDFHEKKVFINFWASWCGPCKEEMPAMEEFHQQYGDEVEIIAVNATKSGHEKMEDVEQFLNQGNYSFTVLLDQHAEVTDSYKILGLPTTYFIGTDGTIQQPHKVGSMTFEFMEEMKNKLN